VSFFPRQHALRQHQHQNQPKNTPITTIHHFTLRTLWATAVQSSRILGGMPHRHNQYPTAHFHSPFLITQARTPTTTPLTATSEPELERSSIAKRGFGLAWLGWEGVGGAVFRGRECCFLFSLTEFILANLFSPPSLLQMSDIPPDCCVLSSWISLDFPDFFWLSVLFTLLCRRYLFQYPFFEYVLPSIDYSHVMLFYEILMP
jgi:hypothetical protein